jgi:DNA repair exonuclease SbcCD nuclease subunit
VIIANFGDLHLTDEKPKSRIELDLFEVQMGKLTYSFNYMADQGVSLVTFSGDIFDKPRVSNRVITEFGNLLSEFGKKGMNFVTTLGQHDIKNYNYARWDRDSDVYILSKLGLIDVLVSGQSKVYDSVKVYGYGIREEVTEDFLHGKVDLEPKDKLVRVALVHASVCDTESPWWEDVKNLNIKGVDWAFFGDIHQGFDPYQFSNKTIALSCGTMTRMKVSEVDIEPRFVIVDTKSKKLEFVAIPHAEAAFAITEEKEAHVVEVMEGFAETLTRARARVSESNEEVFLRVAKVLGVSPVVEKLGLVYLERVK